MMEPIKESVVEPDLGSTRAVLLGEQQEYGEAVEQSVDEDQASGTLDLTSELIDKGRGDSRRRSFQCTCFVFLFFSVVLDFILFCCCCLLLLVKRNSLPGSSLFSRYFRRN